MDPISRSELSRKCDRREGELRNMLGSLDSTDQLISFRCPLLSSYSLAHGEKEEFWHLKFRVWRVFQFEVPKFGGESEENDDVSKPIRSNSTLVLVKLEKY